MSMPPWEDRAKEFGFATKEEIKAALALPVTMVLDVRTPEEIAASGGTVHPATPANWVQTNCTADDCADLRASPSMFVPDKNATIVIYCRSGRRAAAAKNVLIGEGYTGPILNAGGYDDIVELAAD